MNKNVKRMAMWTEINTVPAIYPWLYQEEHCQVCVVGGGITGALCALKFASAGVDTVLLAGGPAGYGGTSLASGVMQAELQGGLEKLAKQVGINQAVRVYHQYTQALDHLEELCNSFASSCGFGRKDRFCFVEGETGAEELNEEYLLKKHNGFDVTLIERGDSRDLFSFDLEAGLLSKGLAATVDPYLFTHCALTAAEKAGARIYENTAVEDISPGPAHHTLVTSVRHEVHAQKVILAIGMDCCDFLKGVGSRRTCFAAATRPVEGFAGWADGCVIQKLGRPEITFSITPQGRILTTGMDTGLIDRNRRMAGFLPLDVLAEKKFDHMQAEISRMFPGIRETELEYAYTADYIQTDDGLPIIGSHEDYPGCYFALCSGQNGALFSQVASEVLLELYQGDGAENEQLFSPERLS